MFKKINKYGLGMCANQNVFDITTECRYHARDCKYYVLEFI